VKREREEGDWEGKREETHGDRERERTGNIGTTQLKLNTTD